MHHGWAFGQVRRSPAAGGRALINLPLRRAGRPAGRWCKAPIVLDPSGAIAEVSVHDDMCLLSGQGHRPRRVTIVQAARGWALGAAPSGATKETECSGHITLRGRPVARAVRPRSRGAPWRDGESFSAPA